MHRLARAARSWSTSTSLQKSPLNDLHAEFGGKMVPFAGWSLPVQYSGAGVMAESLFTRSKATVFDVSHMQQLRFHGDKIDRVKFLESVCVGSIGQLKPDQGQYTLLTNEKGGIVDDCIVVNRELFSHVVVNAGCAAKDIDHFETQLKSVSTVEMEVVADQALIALQGPKAVEILSKAVADSSLLTKLPFFYTAEMDIAEVPCVVSRSGYTGEDGFEISIPAERADEVVRLLLLDNDCQLAGLGARDALRLEAGMCLYGHDLDDETTPVEAGLAWTIGKRRRREGGFIGADIILRQLQEGTARQRVGLFIDGAPAREGALILSANESREIGKVTSGGFSPTLKKPIAMGYVLSEFAPPKTQLVCKGRHTSKATVVDMPFVPTRYFKPAKK